MRMNYSFLVHTRASVQRTVLCVQIMSRARVLPRVYHIFFGHTYLPVAVEVRT